ncbi:MAG: hypothetical protein NY202_05685 [Mollicutes bacterium UO1]
MNYFQQHNIQSIILKGNKLLIKYQDREEEKEINNQELQLISSYCQKENLTSLSLEQLQKANTQQPTNYLPLIIGGGIILALLIVVIIYFSTKKKKVN